VPAGANAGVPAESCSDGFIATDGGCQAVLPPEPCGDGEMAIVGETSCRAIAPCGEAPWGEIPVDSTTVYVDGSYAGGSSDGSEAAPWTTIGEAVAAAPAGAVVAIASGTYAEDVRIEGAALRLWGRCPALTRVVGTGMQPAAITVFATDAVELHSLAAAGPRMGVWIRDSADTVVDRIWTQDTESFGLVVRGPDASAEITGSLFDSARVGGVVVHGSIVELSDSEVRNTRPSTQGLQGFGITVDPDQDTGDRGQLTARRCRVEGSTSSGALAFGADLVLESCAIADTSPQPADGIAGQGVQVRYWAPHDLRGFADVRSSVIERSHLGGITVAGGDALVEGTTIRDVEERQSDGDAGAGILVIQDADEEVRSTAEISQSLVERAHGSAAFVAGADVTLDRVVLRDVQPGSRRIARGIEASSSDLGPGLTKVSLRASLIERCTELGAMLAGVDATIEGSVVRSVEQAPGGDGGWGISIQYDNSTLERAVATIRGSLVEDAIGVGLLVSGADATIEGTAIRSIAAEPSGTNGLGLCVQYSEEFLLPAAATIRSARVEDCRETGIMVIGAQAQIEHTYIDQIAKDGAGQFGDGLAVATHPGWPATVTMLDSFVGASSRAGIAAFGANVQLGRTTVECNPIDLDGEKNGGATFLLEDLGGNACGCDDTARPCRVLSSNLQPPGPIE
jgi:hypothetical protein